MLERVAADGGLVYYLSPLLRRCGVRHAFSTRLGGVSKPPFDSLNLGNPQCELQDPWENIHENYRILQRAIGLESIDRCWVHQVHADGVATVRAGQRWESGAKADAIVSNDPTRVAAVRVADCTPILLATPDGRAVAAVHAGWRGVIAGVLPAAVRELCSMSGRVRELVAAIGPAISRSAFEVSADVLDRFEAAFPSVDGIVQRRDAMKGFVDLRAALRRQLHACGVKADQIDVTDLCTVGVQTEFFSHRRDAGITGRMAALICANQ